MAFEGEKGLGIIMGGGTSHTKALKKGAQILPSGKRFFAVNASGTPICGAKVRRKEEGATCQSVFIMANGRCRVHGGLQKRGVDNINFIHGDYASVLKGDLAANFKALKQDKNLVSMRSNIALLGGRIIELCEQLDGTNNRDSWAQALYLTESIRSAAAKNDSAKVELYIDKLKSLIEGAIDNDKLWDKIGQTAELQRKQAETEQKLVGLAYKMMSGEEMYYILTVLTNEINSAVSDPQVRAHLGSTIKRLVSPESSGSANRDSAISI